MFSLKFGGKGENSFYCIMFVWFFLNRNSGNSLYELMGLEKAATHEEIKKAYRRVGILKKHIYMYIYIYIYIQTCTYKCIRHVRFRVVEIQ